jgi:hypothetical protein
VFGSDVLEVATGLIFVYFLLALICSCINEWIARQWSMRAATLESGVRHLVNEPTPGASDLAKSVMSHPLIKGMAQGKRPSYVAPRTFALALLDTVAPTNRADGPPTIESIRQAILNLPPGHLRQILLIQVDDARGDLSQLQANIETWFDTGMDRVAGWYKRKIQLIVLGLALAITCAFNADTVSIAASLHRSATVRAAVVAAASRDVAARAGADVSNTPLTQVGPIQQELNSLAFPLGWSPPSAVPTSVDAWLSKIVGLLVTTVAVSLGAPFWFDLLNRITDLRSSGTKPG